MTILNHLKEIQTQITNKQQVNNNQLVNIILYMLNVTKSYEYYLKYFSFIEEILKILENSISLYEKDSKMYFATYSLLLALSTVLRRM